MNKIDEMKELVELLNKASDAYYNGKETLMSDAEFDLKLKHLQDLEKEFNIVLSNSPTVNVGAPVLDSLEKVKHEYKPMLSLAKVHSSEEVVKFANREEMIAMVKLDGLSCRLTYQDGKLIKAETRGNGETGSLIYEHSKQFKNIPLTIDRLGTYVIDGESVITNEDFTSINEALPIGVEKFKNSRNLASGTLALLDMSIVKERKITFVAWDVIVGSNEKTIMKKLDEAKKLGFDIVPYVYQGNQDVYPILEQDVDKINNIILNMAKEDGYLCDGVVWKFNNVAYGERLGRTEHHFNLGIAWKPELVEYETELIDIKWSCSKNSINPVAIFKPTLVNGNTIERASCHNINYVEDLELGIGDKITIYLANEIIPQINLNLTRSGTCVPPEHCPTCNHKTEIVYGNDGTKTLVCTNDMCESKLLGRLKTFVGKSGMDIENLSQATLELLMSRGYISTFKDLYHLSDYKAELSSLPKMGSRSVKKLLDAIEKSRSTTLDKFLTALSIPQCGKATCKDIAKYCHGSIDEFIFIINNTALEFLTLDKFGDKMLDSLLNWWDENMELVHELLEELVIKVPEDKKESVSSVDLSGKSFVITGSLNHFENRDQLKELLESLGAKVSGSVSKNTFALICNEDSNSSKCKKSKELGIPIWTEEDLLKYIGE